MSRHASPRGGFFKSSSFVRVKAKRFFRRLLRGKNRRGSNHGLQLFNRLVAACGTRAACAASDGFGIARSTATTFGVFLWLQVKNFAVSLLHSALVRDFQPNRKQLCCLLHIHNFCVLRCESQRILEPYRCFFGPSFTNRQTDRTTFIL